jgi:hypothetical protein
MTSLDTTINKRIDRFYNRLVASYEQRLKNARDKTYAHDNFLTWGKAHTIIKKEINENYGLLFFILDKSYKLGNPIKLAIQSFRDRCEENRNNCFQEIDSNWPEEEKDDDVYVSPRKELDKRTDYELACLFADQKAKDLFYEFLKSKNITEDLKSSNNSQENFKEITENNKEFTTARQVLAVHFLLEYAQVRNVDKSEIARFIQFLTGKNYDNIYKKVLNPYSHNNKIFKQDLKFVREFFEKLKLQELVKMINNEIDVEI